MVDSLMWYTHQCTVGQLVCGLWFVFPSSAAIVMIKIMSIPVIFSCLY